MTTTPAAPTGSVGAPPGSARQSRVSAPWTGFIMIIGAVIAAVGAFLPWEKLEIFDGEDPIGSIKLSGLKLTTTGQASDIGATLSSAGKTVLGGAVIVAVAGLLIALRKGKLWVGIVALLVGLAVLGTGAANFGAAESDAKDLLKNATEGISIDATRDIGVLTVTVGGALVVLAAILALVKRRPAA